MKVLHCGSIDIKTGGPALSTSLSMKGAQSEGITSEIWQESLRPDGKLISDAFTCHFQAETSLASIDNVDVYHIQGIWQWNNHKMASYARRIHKPYIVTLRGMLYPQGFEGIKGLKKRMALCLYQRKDLQKASCIQVTCNEEMKYYRDLGFTNPVAVIPNPIETKGTIEQPIVHNDKIRFGFLGRLDPRKRVERLIYAFSERRDIFKDSELIIMGAWDKEYEDFLKKEVQRLSLNNVIFTGFISGKEKDATLKSLSALVVPSDFENFGNIVTEALVRGVPVIASKGTPWEDLETYNCGYWINNDQKTITKVMSDIHEATPEYRRKMGENARRLIQEKYSLEENGKKLASLYRWLAGEESLPSFVYYE